MFQNVIQKKILLLFVHYLNKIKWMGFSNSSVGKESTCNAGDPGLILGLGRSAGEGIGCPFQYSWAPCGSVGKESTCNMGGLGSTPGLGISPGEEKVYPLQYSGLENSMGCIVHGFPKSWTRLNPDAGKDWGVGAGGEGDDRGWDSWMASPTRWTWV